MKKVVPKCSGLTRWWPKFRLVNQNMIRKQGFEAIAKWPMPICHPSIFHSYGSPHMPRRAEDANGRQQIEEEARLAFMIYWPAAGNAECSLSADDRRRKIEWKREDDNSLFVWFVVVCHNEISHFQLDSIYLWSLIVICMGNQRKWAFISSSFFIKNTAFSSSPAAAAVQDHPAGFCCLFSIVPSPICFLPTSYLPLHAKCPFPPSYFHAPIHHHLCKAMEEWEWGGEGNYFGRWAAGKMMSGDCSALTELPTSSTFFPTHPTNNKMNGSKFLQKSHCHEFARENYLYICSTYLFVNFVLKICELSLFISGQSLKRMPLSQLLALPFNSPYLFLLFHAAFHQSATAEVMLAEPKIGSRLHHLKIWITVSKTFKSTWTARWTIVGRVWSNRWRQPRVSGLGIAIVLMNELHL